MRKVMLNDIAVLRADNDRVYTFVYYLDGHSERLDLLAESVLEEWCESYGSTLRGRTEAVRKLCGAKTKIPVLVRESDALIFFPVRSISADGENYWINDNLLAAVLPEGRTKSHLVFLNGLKLTIPYDVRIVRRQRDVCRRCRDALAERQREY